MSYQNLSIWSALPRTSRGQSIVLSCDPKGKKLVYTHGNSAIIRDFENPSISQVYTEHSVPVTCAKYSPSGFYICSGDEHGKVRIWDTVNEEHVLKAEYEPLGGPIYDMTWSLDSQKILVVGKGRDKFAHIFMIDTGASVKGEISGHSKCINSCDWKQTRPLRIVTGGEDNKICFFEGPPFKFKCTRGQHTKYVQSICYSPDGNYFASGGFDGKVFLFEGKEAEFIKEIGSPAHKGGVYGVSWSPDSKQLLTASGDKSCKIWDIESGNAVAEFVIGKEIEDQQVGCLWSSAGHIVSVSLAGFINYLDVNKPGAPFKVVKGHNKPISKVVLSQDFSLLYTGAVDGTVTQWDTATGENVRLEGKGHGIQITGIILTDDFIYTTGYDDNLRTFDRKTNSYDGSALVLGSQPRHAEGYNGGILIVTVSEVCIIKDGKKVGNFPLSYEGLCLSVSSNDPPLVAVGGNDNRTHVYRLDNNCLTEVKVLDHRGMVTGVSFSSDGKFLATCDSDRKVIVYTVPEFERFNRQEWGFHNAKVNCVAWSPNGAMLASGSLDTQIIIWSMKDTSKHIIIKSAHPQSQINGLAWLDDQHIVSAGHDSLLKKWKVKF